MGVVVERARQRHRDRLGVRGGHLADVAPVGRAPIRRGRDRVLRRSSSPANDVESPSVCRRNSPKFGRRCRWPTTNSSIAPPGDCLGGPRCRRGDRAAAGAPRLATRRAARLGLMRAAPRDVGRAELSARRDAVVCRGDRARRRVGGLVRVDRGDQQSARRLPPRRSAPRAVRRSRLHRGRRVGPAGTARRLDGGLAVSGRWAFCSGILPLRRAVRRAACRPSHRRRLATAPARGRPPDRGAERARHLAHARATRHRQPRRRCRGRGRARRPVVLLFAAPRSTDPLTGSRSSGSSRSRSPPRRWATRAGRSTSSSSWRR